MTYLVRIILFIIPLFLTFGCESENCSSCDPSNPSKEEKQPEEGAPNFGPH